MAKRIRRNVETRKRSAAPEGMPIQKENLVILGLGLIVILAGYGAMLEGSVEGFLPLVVSPILLVLGYCVVIPFGLMYKKKVKPVAAASSEQPARA